MKNTKSNPLFIWGTTGIYAVLATFFNSQHELWSDEVASFIIAIRSDSFIELFSNIHNYGHPGLWHSLLYFAHKIYPEPIVLNIVNLLICTLGIYWFLSRAPFSNLEKTLFTLGFFPLYLYPVFNRNYGLCMLLIFVCAHFYSQRKTSFIPLCIGLGLLANTHILGWIISAVILKALLYEDIFIKNPYQPSAIKKGLGYTILGIMMIFSLIITCPDSSALIFDGSDINLISIIKAFGIALLYPGKIIPKVFGYENSIFATLTLISCYVYFSKNIRHFIILFLGSIGIIMFFQLIYPNWGLRHSGFIYLLLIFCFWIDRNDPEHEDIHLKFLKAPQAWMNQHMPSFFIILLVMQISLGIHAIKKELVTEFSSAKSFSKFIKKDPHLKNAIILSEPSGNLDTLRYYLDNPLYYYKRKSFDKYKTKPNKDFINSNLNGLLDAAVELKKNSDKPILILLPPNLLKKESKTIEKPYGSKFTIDATSIDRLKLLCSEKAQFHDSISDENYTVYQLK